MNSHPHLQQSWFLVVFLFCAALVLASVVHYVLFKVIGRKRNSSRGWASSIRRHLGKPARAIFLLTCLLIAIPIVFPLVPVPTDNLEYVLHRVASIAMVLALGWFAIGWVYVLQDAILRRYDLEHESSAEARRVHTQFQLFRRTVIFFIVVVDIGAVLWTFDDKRIGDWGAGLLTSAGLASLLLAAAAKSTVQNFLAGLQIAVTGTIRLDDVIVIGKDSGKIEEINSAYVVMRLWDLRRQIVPLNYFIENPFQNWTRESEELIGAAFLYVDYTVPVKALREQFVKIVMESPLWNGAMCKLHVTDMTDKTMELRCSMSARNSSDNFELRCLVREEMMAWIQENYPDAFPTMRFREMREEGAGNREQGSGGAKVH